MTRRLTREQERDLIERWQAGDEAAGEHIVKAFDNYLHGWAHSYIKHGVDHEDLYQVARMGLLEALKRFDPDEEARFETYMRHRVRAEVDRFVIEASRPVRYGLSRGAKILFFHLKREAYKARQEFPDITQSELTTLLAKRLQVSEAMVEEATQVFFSNPLELDKPVYENGTAGDFLVDESPTPEENVITVMDGAVLSKALNEAISALDQRETAIIRNRVMSEGRCTLEDMAAQLGGLSKERARQLEARALRKLRKRLSKDARFEAYA